MKRKILIGYIVYIIVIVNNCYGYFYHLCVMQNVNNKKACHDQLIIGLADYHDKIHPANNSHRLYMENILLKRCAAEKGKLIVEDLSSVNNDGKMNCCNFTITSDQGVLGTLANKARESGVLVDNVEYRYCRVASISPLLNNITQAAHSFKSAATITTDSLHQEVIDEIEAIKRYDDGKKLNTLYKRAIAMVSSALASIALCNKYDYIKKSTVAHYCSRFPRDRYRQELEKLCIFDSSLIDMKIMHSIAQSLHVPLIIVAAGGSHIKEMSEMLKKIGYKSLFATSQPLCSTIKKVVNVNAQAHVNDVPHPIDITALDKFIE